tara:strand:+ start:256 stop:462 length:207 start_codon:yes stop_codon:yes gene_type:complete
MSFSKDALLHKLQDEADKKERDMKELIREGIYGFIAYYTQDELNRIDLRIIADKYVDEEYETNPRGEK